jgi:hypothetical protein
MRMEVLKWTLALVLALWPRLASAQCRDDSRDDRRGGYPYGGHPYEDAARGSDWEIDGTIRYLLSEERNREALTGAILAEPRFLADFVDAITELPEWRALAGEIVGSGTPPTPMTKPSMGGAAPLPGGPGAARPPRRVERAIARVLSDQDLRESLLDAILEDADFMRTLLARMAGHPEAKALAAERLADHRTTGGSVSGHTMARPDSPPSKQDSPLYACPMHPEVTSGRPGTCPKCGMSLRRMR